MRAFRRFHKNELMMMMIMGEWLKCINTKWKPNLYAGAWVNVIKIISNPTLMPSSLLIRIPVGNFFISHSEFHSIHELACVCGIMNNSKVSFELKSTSQFTRLHTIFASPKPTTLCRRTLPSTHWKFVSDTLIIIFMIRKFKIYMRYVICGWRKSQLWLLWL